MDFLVVVELIVCGFWRCIFFVTRRAFKLDHDERHTVDKDDDMVIVRDIQSDLNITITDADRTGRTLLFKFIQKQNTSEHTYNIRLNGFLMQKESGTVLRQTTVQLTGEKPAATVMLIGISNILYFV